MTTGALLSRPNRLFVASNGFSQRSGAVRLTADTRVRGSQRTLPATEANVLISSPGSTADDTHHKLDSPTGSGTLAGVESLRQVPAVARCPSLLVAVSQRDSL